MVRIRQKVLQMLSQIFMSLKLFQRVTGRWTAYCMRVILCTGSHGNLCGHNDGNVENCCHSSKENGRPRPSSPTIPGVTWRHNFVICCRTESGIVDWNLLELLEIEEDNIWDLNFIGLALYQVLGSQAWQSASNDARQLNFLFVLVVCV